MSYKASYLKGDWIAVCDVCGRKYKSSLLAKRWDGLMCCPDDWEPRQPQDFVRGVKDLQLSPWIRDEASDVFVPVDYSSYQTDFVDVFDTAILGFTKVINSKESLGGTLGGYVLGGLGLGTGTTSSTTSDDITLVETFSNSFIKVLSESTTVTETFSSVITTQTALGGAALGARGLGV